MMKQSLQKMKRLPLWVCMVSVLIFSLGCDNNSDTSVNKVEDKVHSSKTEPETITPSVDMHSAVVSNDIETIKQHILAGSDIDQKDPFGGSSPLISAALFGHKDMVELLIDSGANLNFKNNDGSTALHTAAFFGRPEVVQLLLEREASNGIKNNDGSTPYDTVAGAFEDVKPYYDMFGQALAPMGLVLDYEYLKETRPIIAAMLK